MSDDYSKQYAMADAILQKYPKGEAFPIVGFANSIGFKIYVKDLGCDDISGYISISDENKKTLGAKKL